jgi:hypothetical protein
MKKALMTSMFAFALFAAAQAHATMTAAKADCSAQKAAAERAGAPPKAKADLSACQALKGREKTACEKPLKEQARLNAKATRERIAGIKKAYGCCKNPQKKGCGG